MKSTVRKSDSPAMPDPTSNNADFFNRAADLGFLSRTVSDSLTGETMALNTPPAPLALQRGLLTFEQVEIIETLLQPREVAPGYEILGLIGYGGMGVVYRARQIALDRHVALKTILLKQVNGENTMRRFEHEAVTIGRLVHPNIITAYDFGRHAGRLYLAMELVEGMDVETWLQPGKKVDQNTPWQHAETWLETQDNISEATAWQVARQVAAGLAHAAVHGVVHRDIKPANLLLVPASAGSSLPPGVPLVKIADFGLALFNERDANHTRLTMQGSALGSPHYMPPEQIDGELVDQRSDIYALGATLFHILAGQPPWQNQTLSQIITKKLAGELPKLTKYRNDLSAATVALVAEMMDRNPNNRPADYETLLRRIDAILAERHTPSAATNTTPLTANFKHTVDQRPTSALNQTTQFERKQPQRRAFIMLLGGVLVSGGVIAYWRWKPGSVVPRDCVPSGPPRPLFNGKSIEPPQWQLLAGQWSPEVSEENGYVLAGGAGSVIARRFSDIAPLPAHYQLQCFVEAASPTAVEFYFDLPRTNSEPRWMLRLEQKQLKVGRAPSEREAAPSFIYEHPISSDSERARIITLERHAHGWWIFLDEQPLTSIPLLQSEPLPEFRIKCLGGTANFFDLTFTPLAVEP